MAASAKTPTTKACRPIPAKGSQSVARCEARHNEAACHVPTSNPAVNHSK
jgi:hypothetical protein